MEIQYSPGASIIARAAQRAGLGEFEQNQKQVDLQERNLASREAESRARIRLQEDSLRQQVAENEEGRRQALDKMYLTAMLGEEAAERNELRYTDRQTRDIEKINNAIHQVEMDDSFSPTEKEYFRKQAMAKIAGIQPLPLPKPQSPFPEGREPGKVWTDDRFPGVGFITDKNGDPKAIFTPKEKDGGAGKLDRKDFYKVYMDVKKMLTTENENGAVNEPTHEQVMEYIKNMQQGYEGYEAEAGGEAAVPQGPGGTTWSWNDNSLPPVIKEMPSKEQVATKRGESLRLSIRQFFPKAPSDAQEKAVKHALAAMEAGIPKEVWEKEVMRELTLATFTKAQIALARKNPDRIESKIILARLGEISPEKQPSDAAPGRFIMPMIQ